MQAKIKLLESKQGVVASLSHSQDNETKWEEIKSKIADVQTAYETDFLALSSNLTELKEEATKHKSTIHDHDYRLTQLELDNADCICNSTTIQDYGTRILRLEADNLDNDNIFRAKIETNFLAFSNNITELKNETATRESSILDHDIRLMQLELDNADCTCNYTSVTDYDTRITQLEVANVDNTDVVQILGATTTQLQLERTEDRKNMHTLNMTIEQLALDISSNKDKIIIEQTTVEQLKLERKLDQIAIQNQSESIIKLGDDFSSQTQAMNAQNRSLLLIKEDVEKNRYSVQNINDMLAVLDTEMQTAIAATEDNSERMTHLGHQINETNDLHHNLELRVSYLEGKVLISYFSPDSSDFVIVKRMQRPIRTKSSPQNQKNWK